MRRREFIALLGGATAAAWPLAAGARQQRMRGVGFLGSDSPDLWVDRMRAFHQGLGELGYVEGRNVAIEYRWAQGHNDRLPGHASDLVRRRVSVMTVPGSNVAILAAKAATGTIPIVFGTAGDPVALGLVASLNRPGGNATGGSSLNSEIEPKRLELLHELIPTAKTIAVLQNPNGIRGRDLRDDMRSAARILGVELHVLYATTEGDFDTAFASLKQLGLGALWI